MTLVYNRQPLRHFRRKLRKDSTKTEQVIWRQVRNRQINGLKFYRQYSVGRFIVGFYCPKAKLAIELDGGQHAQGLQKEKDERRTEYLKQFGIKVLRFWDNEVFQNFEAVIDKIWAETEEWKSY